MSSPAPTSRAQRPAPATSRAHPRRALQPARRRVTEPKPKSKRPLHRPFFVSELMKLYATFSSPPSIILLVTDAIDGQ